MAKGLKELIKENNELRADKEVFAERVIASQNANVLLRGEKSSLERQVNGLKQSVRDERTRVAVLVEVIERLAKGND
tara:strand:- start:1213 stop:1443 length:231 start_codon:yes stop_codon:yes gene_type:complete